MADCAWLRLAAADSGWLRLTTADSGWLRLTPADSSWLRLTPADSGCLRLPPADSGWLRLTPADSGWLRLTLADSGWLRSTTAERLTPADCGWLRLTTAEQLTPADSGWLLACDSVESNIDCASACLCESPRAMWKKLKPSHQQEQGKVRVKEVEEQHQVGMKKLKSWVNNACESGSARCYAKHLIQVKEAEAQNQVCAGERLWAVAATASDRVKVKDVEA